MIDERSFPGLRRQFRAGARVEQRISQLTHVLEATRRLNGCAPLDVVLDEVTRAAGALGGAGSAADRAVIARVENAIFVPLSVSDGERPSTARFPLDSHPGIQKAVHTRKTAVCRADELKPPARELISKSGTRIIGCAPIWSGGELVGVLCAGSKARRFAEAQLYFLEGMADLAGLAIRDSKSPDAKQNPSGELSTRVSELTLLLDTARKLAVSLKLEVILWEVATAAAEIAFPEARGKRRAEVLRLEGGRLTRVMVYDELGPDRTGVEFSLTAEPAISQAVQTGQCVTSIAASGVDAAMTRGDQATATAYAPIPAGGQIFGVLAVNSRDRRRFDQSQLRTLEGIAYLAGLAIGHARYVEQIHGLEEAKSKFLSLVAHDLRTPLAVLSGYLSMLADGSIPATGLKRTLPIMLAKVTEMNNLLGQLLDIARLEDRKLLLSLQPLDLSELVRSTVQSMEPLSGDRRIVAGVVTDGIEVLGDRGRLAAIVTNLLENAIKYSAAGSTIEYSLVSTPRLAQVAVKDYGMGIKPEELPMLFTRFGRLAAAEKSSIPGTGLGLYLAREFARMHGGDVTVNSLFGLGSTFILTLPLDKNLPAAPAS